MVSGTLLTWNMQDSFKIKIRVNFLSLVFQEPTKHETKTKRPRSHHRRNISSVSQKAVEESLAIDSSSEGLSDVPDDQESDESIISESMVSSHIFRRRYYRLVVLPLFLIS